MRIKPEQQENYDQGLAKNSDSYGACVYRYADRWALMMEEKIAGGAKLEDIAKSTGHEADTEGITGFMYGAAVTILAHVWIFGEELRRWHNLDVQIHDEGEKANASGGVLNPALFTISKP